MYKAWNPLSGLCCAVLLSLLLNACQGAAAAVTPIAVTAPPTAAAVAIATTLAPTATPTPTATATPTATLTPTLTFTPSLTPTITPTFTPSLTPTLAREPFYRLGRPITGGGVDYIDRSYPYGSTAKGNWPVHHGVEFQNPNGTPVVSVGEGRVYYAGTDEETLFGPRNGYYGNLVVVEHDFFSPDGQPVYSLYGHLSRIEVATGDRIAEGDRIGNVGASGIAIGAHLHFEIRVGDPRDFGSTRNPELWLTPYRRYGLLLGRVVDPEGNYLPDVAMQIRRAGRSIVFREAFSYNDGGQVNRDVVWGENFAIGDMPPDEYELVISSRSGRVRFRQNFTIEENAITWVEVVLDDAG